MSSIFNPYDWYWLADDGRVFASVRQIIVDESDADYQAWAGSATAWPRDLAGNQTDAALQEVLTPYNLWVDLVAYTAKVRYDTQCKGVKITSLSPAYFASDPLSRNTVNSAYDYLLANAAVTIHWKMSDGSFVNINKAACTTLMNNMAGYVQSCYTCENTTIDAINNHTITTKAQVDAPFAAISNVFP